LVNVTPESVRERINVSAAEVPDDVVNRFISAAAVTVGLEIGEDVDASDCTSAQAEAIRNLAAIYCACRITGGSAAGLSFSVGDLAVPLLNPLGPVLLDSFNLQFLLDQAVAIIAKLKGPVFKAVNP